MKQHLYLIAQAIIFSVFLVAFVVTGYKVIFDPCVTDSVKGIFNELKLLFSGLFSVAALKRATTGGNNDEKADSVGTDRAAL